MADVKWNEEQIQAINAKDCSVLVSAAAGSGKTAVLVERVIQLLIDKNSGVMADELLIVTFTNLAAEEMKTRINKRITQMLDMCATDSTIDEAHLRNQQLLLDKAHISTIDSFCKNIVKTSYAKFDISPDYRIGDQAEFKAMQCKAVEEVAQDYYLRDDFEDIASLLTTATNDNTLKELVINFYSFLSALPFPKQWMNQTIQRLKSSREDVIHSVWVENILNQSIRNVEYISGIMKNSCQLLDKLDSLEDFYERFPKKAIQHNSEKELVKKLLNCKEWNEFQETLFSVENQNIFFERAAQVRGLAGESADVYESYKDNRNKIKEEIQLLKNSFALSNDELENQLDEIIRITTVLFSFIDDFTEYFTKLKKEKNILDFADIERFTLLTLAQVDDNGEYSVDDTQNSIRYNLTNEAKALSESFKQVIVDEYQDVNQLQDLIFKIISKNDKNLFVVGDVKQSIYGFRQAMPDIFINRRINYNNLDDSQARNIILKRNYRSRDGVTDYVNFVFANLMQKDLGNLEYTPEDYLVPGAKYVGENNYDVYLHLNNLPKKRKKLRDLAEAKTIAKIIQDNVGKYDVTSGDTTRKAEYKDVAILMRSVKDTTTITEYLEQCRIPVITETKLSLLDCKEVQIVIDLLKVIDNPLQDIPLYSVMVSPIYGFTPQQIAQLRCNSNRKGFLYSNVLTDATHNAQLAEFIDEIEYYREIAANKPTDELINIIYRRTAITEFASALDDGEIVLNNLRLLFNYSKGFENEQNKGVTSFIRYIERAVETGSILEGQTGANTDGNAVRIMTMHHSKGLEFPVCIIANLGRDFKKYNDKMYFDRELGLGLQLKDMEYSASYKSIPYIAIVNKLQQDSVAEELRILYVALTRAREQLHLVGAYANLPKLINSISLELTLYNGIKSDVLLKHNSMLDWLIAVSLLMKPQDGQNDNILWEYTTQFFRKNIAYNSEYIGRRYRDIYIEYSDIDEDIDNNLEDDITISADDIVIKENPIQPNNNIDIEKLNARFNTPYPYQMSVDIPSVVTPSSLTHQGTRTFLNDFDFNQKDTLTSAQRGTAMHTFMEYSNLDNALISPQEEIDLLVQKGYLTQLQAESISIDYITKCLNTSIMQSFIKSENKYKEVKFEVMVKASVTGFGDCDEEHMLRGSVDAAFEEDNQIVIIDYKTDRVNSIEELKEKYSTQLLLYKLGLSATLNLPVKKCVIYSFYLNDFIEV
ncbi:MAG: helicase-exonuclease AddAB subunit AddA [Acutalibacteraceae bacterium]|nr:helicase-exonuclease AddAB subunit AddA [Acutalibacteraceae bacterium]